MPSPLPLPRSGPPVLALGGFLKNTVCVTRGGEAFVSPIIGDLDSPERIAALEAWAERLVAEAGVEPVRVAHDLHPDFPSTRLALALDLPAVGVQHHHAHAAAVMAEHGLAEPVLAVTLDGFGLGTDGGAWGGEMLLADGPRVTRLGHFAPLLQPGGDRAAVEPWRMAAAVLHRLGRADEIASRFAAIPAAAALAAVIATGFNCPETSSAGRLFDAAAGLLGLCPQAGFEGEAPAALEALVTVPEIVEGGWTIEGGVLDFLPLLARLAACTDPVRGANLFHGTLAAGLAEWAVAAAHATGIGTVVLGGGCFLNRVLADGLTRKLAGAGLRPLVPVRLPPGDQALSFGQAWIALQTE